MGQKTNPILLRLGKTFEWKSKYYEKKLTEQPIYVFKDLEIRKFISQYFKNQGLTVQQIKLYHLENSLHICVSYFTALKSTLLINTINKAQRLKLSPQRNQQKRKSRKKHKKIKEHIQKILEYQKIDYTDNVRNLSETTLLKKASSVIENSNRTNKIRRIKLLKYYKKFILAKLHKTMGNIKNNAFIEKFIESLNGGFNKKIHIFLTLKQLNKNIKQTLTEEKLKLLKRTITQLRKYRQYDFFKEGINIILVSMTNHKSSTLLAEFLASQIKKLKRHNSFFKFIKTALTLFSSSSLSHKIGGIKLKAKGRFNGAPRAKHKIINIGNGVPLLTIKSKIDYAESTAYTANGTFGTKVWIYEKS
jgi:ribosomal protein S3